MVRWLGRLGLRLVGWRAVGRAPDRSVVLIAAPHTSNWDLLYMLLVAAELGIDVHWVGKHTLFRPPLGWLMRAVGGIPVDRRARHGAVAQLARAFEERPGLVLAVAPEGTRGKAPYWKSGFYEIARGAGVPIACGFLDYARKEGGIGPLIEVTGDRLRDMDAIRAFYADKTGKHPEDFTPPRLREEVAGGDDQPAAGSAAQASETSSTASAKKGA
ncbi:MAG: acyltransferase [Deltaproteobacteria bacterium]|nr:MAG: acyltransferase [Deltaproteobacteria bacterium]